MSCLESFFGWKKPKSGRKNGSIIYHSNTDTTVESGRTAEELLEELTQLTIVGFAKAAETKDTALHVACEYHYSDDLIINVLLDGDPDSTFKENGNGDLPLHLAMKDAKQCDENNEQNGASEKVVEALLSKNKRAVEHLNHSDCLPIHIACDKNNGTANEFIIKRLLDIYPDSVMMHCKLKKTLDATNIYDDEDEELLTSTNLNESKSGLYSYFMDSVDTLREAFLKPSCNRRDTNGEDDGIESNLTPLHLAVMNNLSPDIISSLLNANSYCLNLETSEGRTAMDIAKSTPNADGSIEVMKSYNKNVTKLLGLKVVSQALIDATADEILKGNVRLDEPAREKKDPKMLWKKASIAVRFINTLTASVFALNEMDNDESMMAPTDYKPPDNLEFECVDITLPVGFRQLRQGLLSNESPFYKQFHENNMNFSEFEKGEWDKFNDKIGQVEPEEEINEGDFVGATRVVNYLMPKTMVVPENMAYTTEEIVEYTNYSIAIKRVCKNPDVVFGKTFECHCLDVFINTGSNTCRMISTTEAHFYDRPPMIAWKIKNAMKNGVTEKSIALGESICDIRASNIGIDV